MSLFVGNDAGRHDVFEFYLLFEFIKKIFSKHEFRNLNFTLLLNELLRKKNDKTKSKLQQIITVCKKIKETNVRSLFAIYQFFYL